MGYLDGKAALVTGGTRGIGRAIVEALLSEGCNVVMNGRSPEKGKEATDAIGAGDRLTFLAGDVSDKETCFGLVAGTIERYGQIDIVVNNAGGSVGSSVLWEMDDADWDYTLNWNLNHAVWTTKKAIPDMIKRGWGRIINISSIYGKMSLPTVAHYVTTKHAMIGLTKAVAAETGTLGITCNAICPGFIKTDVFMTEGPVTAAAMGMAFEDWVGMVTQISMTKTTNEAEEVAAMALLLCSPQGKGITGAALNVDGGACPY